MAGFFLGMLAGFGLGGAVVGYVLTGIFTADADEPYGPD